MVGGHGPGRTPQLRSKLGAVAGLLAAVALLCVVWIRGSSRSELEVFPVRGGGEFGFQPNEAGVSNKEQVEAMAGLIAASGGRGEVLSAADAQEDQRRWLAPYFSRKAAAMQRRFSSGPTPSSRRFGSAPTPHFKTRFGDGPIPSAVNLDSQPVPLRTVSPRVTTFERNALGGSLPVDTAVDGVQGSTSRAKAKMQLLEEAYAGPDHFAPQVKKASEYQKRERVGSQELWDARVGADDIVQYIGCRLQG
jgi:hypothetical protein